MREGSGDSGATRPPASRRGCGLWLPSGDSISVSPYRVRGSPLRPKFGPVRRRGSIVNGSERGPNGGTRGARKTAQVSRSGRGVNGANGLDLGALVDEEGDVEDLFGQLWFIPSASPSPCGRARVCRKENLVWIRKDLWDSKSFEPSDCHPVGVGDLWVSPPKKFCFASDIWGKGVKDSFVSKLKFGMAGRGRGGRGP